jgi:hypothetical protein
MLNYRPGTWLAVVFFFCSGDWDLSQFQKKDRKEIIIGGLQKLSSYPTLSALLPSHFDDNQQLISN